MVNPSGRRLNERKLEEGEKSKLFTVSEVEAIMKRKAYLFVGESLEFDVKILAHKFIFGHNRFLVTPLAGKSQSWMDAKYIFFRENLKSS